MSALLEVEQLSRSFGGLRAVDRVSLEVGRGEIVGVIGPNGAGKTTLVNLVTGVVRPSSGSVRFDGKAITGMAAHRLARLGLVRTFQSTAVYRGRSVRENALRGAYLSLFPGVVAALLNTGEARRRRARTEVKVAELLGWLDLDGVADADADSLPYGLQKALGIVIALAADPGLILLDEPVAGLNAAEADHVRATVARARDRGLSVVVIDHNMRFIAGLCDRVVVMHHGQELVRGTPKEVLSDARVIDAYLGKAHAAAHG